MHSKRLDPADAPGGPVAAPGVGSAGAAESSEWLRRTMDGFLSESAEVLAYFTPEAAEHLDSMTRSLLALEEAGQSEEELGTFFRSVHTLKGAAYTVGCTPVGDLAHRIEDLLVEVQEDRVPFTPAVIEALSAGTAALRLLLASVEGPSAELPAVLERAVTSLGGLMPPPVPSEPQVAAAVPPEAATSGVTSPESAAPTAPIGARGGTPAPLRPGMRVELERLDSLMNLVGELVIARSRLDRRLLQLEHVGELLLSTSARVGRVVQNLEGSHDGASRAETAPAENDAPDNHGTPDAGPFMARLGALDLDRYSDVEILARGVGEISADLWQVQTELASAKQAISAETVRIQRLTNSLRNEVTRARMVPVAKLFARVRRQVREAARSAGKMVVLEVSGEPVKVDNAVIEQISDPLLHLVQNAVFHGIETEAERRSLGKRPHGTVYLGAYHQGGFVHVEVKDDGRGIDVELLKEQAVRRGLLPAEVARLMEESEALNLIFLPGLSTAPLVTTGAGRGVGMDVVRTNVDRLNGEIKVETAVGLGTRFTLKLPLTVVISESLMVRVGSETLAIPLNAALRVLMVHRETVQSVGRGEMLHIGDHLVDLIRLDQVLALSPLDVAGHFPVIVLRVGSRFVAVAVSELLGIQEIVIKSLGAFLDGVGPFAGATISGDGRVILLLDPVRLVDTRESAVTTAATPTESYSGEVAGTPSPSLPAVVRQVLLVDDSLSVRKFVGHLLEKAGFRVITATDGAEALERLMETAFHAVITDLEMPRVNGFELIQDLRRRPATRDIPVVVLTTRAGAKYLNLARWLGIQHYLSKPVDEDAFVQLIDSLTAPAQAAAHDQAGGPHRSP